MNPTETIGKRDKGYIFHFIKKINELLQITFS